ncbi:MAG: PD-(D/E)XK nuclease domain-containing protein, partial [Lachnospiraceae bacterium]|nr:PD-(D/E)XK nuclease domain-containing protein [Lachnospiraceae bacterium]
PWSVIQFMDDLQENHEWFPRSYWANTSSNSNVRKLIERADDSVKGEIEHLIDGGTIEKPVHEDITYDEIYKTMDNIWNFMFFTGYFRKVDERMDDNDVRWLTMRLPNREVRYIFCEKIMSWFQEKIQEKDLTNLYTAFVNKDTDTLEEELSQILFETISSMDENENYYHGIVAGLLSPMKGYRTKSNRESGKGRSDLFIKPVSRRKEAFVVEFKVAKKPKELEKKAEEAIKQIEDRQYAAELDDDGYEIVVKYGIAFCGKDCLVKFQQ